jgi:hypothetical protein
MDVSPLEFLAALVCCCVTSVDFKRPKSSPEERKDRRQRKARKHGKK